MSAPPKGRWDGDSYYISGVERLRLWRDYAGFVVKATNATVWFDAEDDTNSAVIRVSGDNVDEAKRLALDALAKGPAAEALEAL